jgi:hypothetical protein
MARVERQRLTERVRELENYLEGLARGGAGPHAHPNGHQHDVEAEIARTKREIEALRRQLQAAT